LESHRRTVPRYRPGDEDPGLAPSRPRGWRQTRFGQIVVQGGVTSAILNAVVAEDLPGPGTVFLQVNWSFKAPVRPGDTITGRVQLTEARTDKPITKMKTTVTRNDGVVVLDGDAICFTFALPGGRPPPG